MQTDLVANWGPWNPMYPHDSDPAFDDTEPDTLDRDLRRSYRHLVCGSVTRMGTVQAGEVALGIKPEKLFCRRCAVELLLREFVWDGTEEIVGE